MIRKMISNLIQLKKQNLFIEEKNVDTKYIVYILDLFKALISDSDMND